LHKPLLFCFFYNTLLSPSHQGDNGTFSSQLSSTEQCPNKSVNLLLLWVVFVIVWWHFRFLEKEIFSDTCSPSRSKRKKISWNTRGLPKEGEGFHQKYLTASFHLGPWWGKQQKMEFSFKNKRVPFKIQQKSLWFNYVSGQNITDTAG
jgi:hypothetical protein